MSIHNIWKDKSIKINISVLGVLLIFNTGCKKFVEVGTPNTNIDSKNVYSNNTTAVSVLTGLYTSASQSGLTGTDIPSVGFMTGLSGDELTLYSGDDPRLQTYYQNNVSPSGYSHFWSNFYKYIYITNLAIQGITNSSTLTPALKQQLLGEARFMRALYYFYLVNLYGDAPLALSTDYTVNAVLSRSPQDKVWAQIITDLKEAEQQLSAVYLDGTILKTTTDRLRPTRWAAKALLARCYLYTHDWANAAIKAGEVINNTTLYGLEDINTTFLKNNKEAIWQLQPVNSGYNTEDAKMYIIQPAGPSGANPVYLSAQLLSSFEAGDNRRKKWIGSVSANGVTYYYAYKYKSATFNAPITEYHTVFRLAEQFLIRAEARTALNNLPEALDDVNAIRNRAGLAPLNLTTQDSILTAIYHERQVELFTEGGHRWFDLKRTKIVDDVMAGVAPAKGTTWNTNWQLYPIPSDDILRDGNLIQNKGY